MKFKFASASVGVLYFESGYISRETCLLYLYEKTDYFQTRNCIYK